MDQFSLGQLLHEYGQAGMFIAFLIWDRLERAKEAKERIETEKATSAAMASLTTVLTTFVTTRRIGG